MLTRWQNLISISAGPGAAMILVLIKLSIYLSIKKPLFPTPVHISPIKNPRELPSLPLP